MVDAMAIKKQIEFDSRSQRFSGFVDLGMEEDNSTPDEAKEVLVVMLVGLRGRWKAPVAFYFTKGLNAEAQTVLIKDCLSSLNELGFVVCGLTLDGHATNVAMCKQLGCNLSLRRGTLTTHFTHEGANYRTYVMLDMCHMVKLVRTMLHAYGVLVTPDGRVYWQAIKDLHTVQQNIGLRLANKLRNDHIQFLSQKMKVNLAVQTLSTSVADALQFLMETGMPGFSNVGPTVTFIRKIDAVFDILNCKSAFGKGTKAALKCDNWPAVCAYLEEARSYLMALTGVDGTPIYQTPRGTCILGLCCCIESVKGLVSDLLFKATGFQYLLTYKLSQDHLELFFNAVRQGGGCNNNPTALQFKAIFRKLIARAGSLHATSSANISQRDETGLLQAAASTYVPPTSGPGSTDQVDASEDLQHRQEIQRRLESAPIVVKNILVYMAGWVVKKVLEKVKCDVCRESLVNMAATPRRPDFCLLKTKNRGGLRIPSDGVVRIISAAEKHLRNLTNVKKVVRNVTSLQIEQLVLADVGGDCLGIVDHARMTGEGIESHYFDVVRMLVNTFFNVRIHHIVRLHNEVLQAKKIRQKSNKLVLFKGQ